VHILIVDDEFTCRKLLGMMLKDYGHYDMAANGEEALEAFAVAAGQGEPYDLILLDIMMPDLDGQQLLQEFRHIEESKGILLGDGAKIVMTTALSDAKTIMRSFRQQCDAYLVKPIEPEQLTATLAKLEIYPIVP